MPNFPPPKTEFFLVPANFFPEF